MASAPDLAAAEPRPPLPANPAESHPFSFHGRGSSFFALVLKNMLLTLVTLGIYAPWAKTERRRYLWQNIEIAGHRLLYHGTGRELFIGYVKVVLGYVVFIGAPLLVGKLAGKLAQGLTQAGLVLLLIPIIPWRSGVRDATCSAARAGVESAFGSRAGPANMPRPFCSATC
jgi:uncharacterized membrane protein YjgN (DUF898 family)